MNNNFDILSLPCILLFILCAIVLICNIIGLVKMFTIEKKIRFEKYVLISGIIEIILICLFTSKFHKEIIQDCIQALQTFIILYLSKKFLNLYVNIVHSLILRNSENVDFYKVRKKVYGKKIYNAFFWFFAILNIISISSDIISEIIIDKEKLFIYNSIDFINNFVSLLISIILIIFSLMIWNIVEIQSNLLISFDDEINEIYSRNEKYLSTRKIQIIIISFGNFFTDLFEIIILFLKKITFRRKISFNKIENKINLFDILVSYSLWLNTFLNFIAIYFIVRNSFNMDYTHLEEKKKSDLFITQSLIERDTQIKFNNNEIEDFLSDDNNKKENNNIDKDLLSESVDFK